MTKPRVVLMQSGAVRAYSPDVQAAMRLLEPLLNAGMLALHPDRWRGGRLTFLRPAVAMRQGWLPPGASSHEG